MAIEVTSNPTVREVIEDWPETSPGQQQQPKDTAKRMREKYGEPDEVTPNRLVWHDNGPWKRTEVRRDGPRHDFPVPHVDHLYQYVDYRIPPEKHDDLARFDGSVHAHRTEGELVAACHKEEANVLAINLAHDIVTDELTVEEARDEYAKILAKLMAGGSPAYTQAFQFPLPEGDQRDPDVTIARDRLSRDPSVLGLVSLAIIGFVYYMLKRNRGRRPDQRRGHEETRKQR